MAVIDLPIVGQSYHLKDWAIDCQRTLNFYPQVVESGNAPQVSALLPTPGLVSDLNSQALFVACMRLMTLF